MKSFSLLTALCTAFSIASYAAEDSEFMESRIAQVESTLSEHSKLFERVIAQSQYDSGNTYSSDTMTTKTPSDQNVVMHSAHGCMNSGFMIQAEFLWWRANMDMLEYVLQSNGENTILSSTQASFKEPDFEYDPGVRVAIGYDFGRSNWDVKLAWTYHYTDVSDSSRGPGDSFLSQVATRFQSASDTFYNFIISSNAKADWQTRLNALDFEMGYDYFFSDRFSMRPHFGLKAAWIDMHYNAAYDTMLDGAIAPADPSIFTGSMRSHSEYWAVGPRMGFDTYLHIGWGFSLYGKFAGALIYGEYDTTSRFSFSRPPPALLAGSGTLEGYPLKHNDYSRLRTMAEMAIGLEWGYCFSNDYYLGFNIAWENQYWWNQLEMYYLTTDFHPRGDLTYSGLDVGLRFDF